PALRQTPAPSPPASAPPALGTARLPSLLSAAALSHSTPPAARALPAHSTTATPPRACSRPSPRHPATVRNAPPAAPCSPVQTTLRRNSARTATHHPSPPPPASGQTSSSRYQPPPTRHWPHPTPAARGPRYSA